MMSKEKINEVGGLKLKGQWKDKIWKKNPDGSIYLVKETDWNSNTVVFSAREIISGLLAAESGWGGYTFHCCGEGSAAWDSGGAPVPAQSQTLLLNEITGLRKAPDTLTFLDPNTDLPTGGAVSRKVEIVTTFDFGDGPAGGAPIREQAIFGGDATASINSGLMFNVINHTKIFKDSTVKLERTIRILIDMV